MKKIILTESQSNILADMLNEETYQMPVDKKVNKPYCINPEKVLIVKKFLDKTFKRGLFDQVGPNGLPKRIKVVAMLNDSGTPLKNMYMSQLHDLLIDKFQHMFSDTVERSMFMKRVMDDWFDNKIGVHGLLSVNCLKEETINEISSDEVTAEANEADLNPTDAQKEAGNYKMGHFSVKGMGITIENPAGSKRTYTKEDGSKGSIVMQNHYGYFKNTSGNGKDGDAVDVFIGPDIDNFDKVFVVDQYVNNEFDESKVMLGFESADEARDAYLSNYDDEWDGLRNLTAVSIDVFKKWLYRKHKQRKPFADYAAIKKKKLSESIDKGDFNPPLPKISKEMGDFVKFAATHDEKGDIRKSISFDGWERVTIHGKMNLRSTKTGEFLSNKWFSWIGYMTDGLAIVCNDDAEYNIIDKDGNLKLPKWYDDVKEPINGKYIIVDGDTEIEVSPEDLR